MRDLYDPETMVVGVLGRPHGLRGEVTLRPFNPGGDTFGDAEALILEQGGVRQSREVENLRGAGQTLILKLAGIEDRDAAAALTGAVVRLPRASLPPLEPGEFYVEDVVGCTVLPEGDGPALGVATATFWNGAHDVMTVVDEAGGGRERLIPLVPDFVLAVDVPGRKIRVRWGDENDHQ